MNTLGPLIDEWENFKAEGEVVTHPVDEWFKARDIDPVELVEVCDGVVSEVTQHAANHMANTGTLEAVEKAPAVIASIMFHFGFEVAAKRYGKDIT